MRSEPQRVPDDDRPERIWRSIASSFAAPAGLSLLLSDPPGESDMPAWRDALARRVGSLFPTGAAGHLEDWNAGSLWTHSVATACAATRLAEQLDIGAGDAFAAGLLHDVGRAALVSAAPRSYVRLVRRSESSPVPWPLLEEAWMGVDHATIGRRLADEWRLAPWLSDCIWLHHHPADLVPVADDLRRRIELLQLADALAWRSGFGWCGRSEGWAEIDPLASRLGLTDDDVRAAGESIAADVSCLLSGENAPDRAEDATARRAHRAARWLRGSASLIERAGREHSTSAGCRRAAETLRQALDLNAALVFVVEDGEAVVGVSVGGGGHRSASARLTVEPALAGVLSDLATQTRDGPVIAPLPAACAALHEPYAVLLGRGPAWLLPLVADPRTPGAAVFVAPRARAAELIEDGEALAALRDVCASALATACRHSAGRRRSDGLASALLRVSQSIDDAVADRASSAVAEMASGAAHELNSPLAIIDGRAQQLLASEPEEATRGALEAIRANVARCTQIVSELQAFAEPPPPRLEAVDLAALLRETAAEWTAAGRVTAGQLRLELSDGLPLAWVDRGYLRESLELLLANALQATDPGSRLLTIKAARHPTDDHSGWVVISMADNGRGMTPEVRERAFDPFFSYRPAGRGRGLGLSRVRRMVTGCGGFVRLESAPDRGTTVTLGLPGAPSQHNPGSSAPRL